MSTELHANYVSREAKRQATLRKIPQLYKRKKEHNRDTGKTDKLSHIRNHIETDHKEQTQNLTTPKRGEHAF